MQNNKNFQDVLLAHINNITKLPLKARLDYFEDDKDDLVINALSGGTIDKEYMDGTREVSLPFEIAVKARIEPEYIANKCCNPKTAACECFCCCIINLPP